MAETRPATAASAAARRRSGPRPHLPHPPAYSARPRPLLEETQDLRPAVQQELAAPVTPPAPETRISDPGPGFHAIPISPRRAAPPRDRTILVALLLGLVLNAVALMRNQTLARSDVLLGGTVLLAGITLLVLMEVYRRIGRS